MKFLKEILGGLDSNLALILDVDYVRKHGGYGFSFEDKGLGIQVLIVGESREDVIASLSDGLEVNRDEMKILVPEELIQISHSGAFLGCEDKNRVHILFYAPNVEVLNGLVASYLRIDALGEEMRILPPVGMDHLVIPELYSDLD